MKHIAIMAACLFASQQALAMDLNSPDIANGAAIPMAQIYRDCHGSNVSPALNWSGVPKDAKSLVVTMYDRDVQGGFWHWIVYDIPPDATGLAKGAGTRRGKDLPPGAKQGANSFGNMEYDGPCPPTGQKPHHYEFTVWGMSVKNADPTYVGNAIWFASYLHQHAMAKATFEGVFGR
jgi:Raf kinase inhibitor-like YbhB/YbcL family protein